MMESSFRSFREQTAHYFFSRRHEGLPSAPVDVAAAWRGHDLPALADLAAVLTASEVVEIEAAIERARRSGRPRAELSAADFPLPELAPRIQLWRKQLSTGIGFQVIRGVPVKDWSQDDAELFFWCLGLHLGHPGGQNAQGDLLGHVADLGTQRDDAMVRLYQTASRIRFHCDAADVVGLLCLRKAKTGGQSRVASSVTVFNEVLSRRPDLAARLFEPFAVDLRNETEGGATSFQMPPCRYAEGRLRTFYHADYFRSALRHPDVPDLTEDEEALLDLYEAIANEEGIYFDMDLEPGDIQLLSNHTNLHARTDYVDSADPSERRHLLRLWLSL